MTPIQILLTDIDVTLLGDRAATARFNLRWRSLSEPPLLAYGSARPAAEVLDLIESEQLLLPGYIIAANGAELFDRASHVLFRNFHERFLSRWDAQRVDEVMAGWPLAIRQAETHQNPDRRSFHWCGAAKEELDAVEQALAAAGLAARLHYSMDRFLDVLPEMAGKAAVLRWLARQLGVPLRQAVVAGDARSDRDLFELGGVRGIVLGKRSDEAGARPDGELYCATRSAAAGLHEGLVHFGLWPAQGE